MTEKGEEMGGGGGGERKERDRLRTISIVSDNRPPPTVFMLLWQLPPNGGLCL